MLQQDYFENYAEGLNISKMLAMRVKKNIPDIRNLEVSVVCKGERE
jgi:hypothetical protein